MNLNRGRILSREMLPKDGMVLPNENVAEGRAVVPPMKMTTDEQRKYLRIMQPRYLKAGRAEKTALLDEMEEVIDMHRKSLTRLLHSDLKRHKRERERDAEYGPEVDEGLALIANGSHYVCAERSHGGLLTTAERLFTTRR